MCDPTIIDGRIYAPFFIFIHCGQQASDETLLKRLGLKDYHLFSKGEPYPNDVRSHVHIASDGEWTHVAGDWYYSLWYRADEVPNIANIASDYDVYACGVGDVNRSYSFCYYANGALVRKLVVEYEGYSDESITEEIGSPLPFEHASLDSRDELDAVMSIAEGLGIDLNHARMRVRTYIESASTRIRRRS